MKNKIEILINEPTTHYLDVGDFDMPINYSLNDVRNLSKRGSAYSKTIKIPGTKNNNFVLGGLFDINADYSVFNPNKKTPVKVLIGIT